MGLLGGILLKPVGGGIPTDGLVAYYPFNGNADDESGNGNDGTPTGGASLTTGRKGDPNHAYLFDGIDGEIIVPISSSLNTPSDNDAITISLWVKNLDLSQVKYLLNYRANSWALFYGFVGNNYEYFQNAPGFRFESGEPINADWNHVFVQTILSPAEAKGYFNNNLIHDGSGIAIPLRSATQLNIGSSGGVNFLDGAIDDIRIYNRFLTSDERDALFNE